MPINNARYRVVNKKGKKIRLAFVNGKVVEAKNLKTGATHTPAEFKADRKKAATRKRKSASRKARRR